MSFNISQIALSKNNKTMRSVSRRHIPIYSHTVSLNRGMIYTNTVNSIADVINCPNDLEMWAYIPYSLREMAYECYECYDDYIHEDEYSGNNVDAYMRRMYMTNYIYNEHTTRRSLLLYAIRKIIKHTI